MARTSLQQINRTLAQHGRLEGRVHMPLSRRLMSSMVHPYSTLQRPSFRPAIEPGTKQSTFRSLSSSAGSTASLQKDTEDLTCASRGRRRWRLTSTGDGLERVFRFKTFKATWAFMDGVAAQCKAHKHHPKWTNIYNKTHIQWTTHDPPGLTGKDIEMAKCCDELAAAQGEVDATDAQMREDEALFAGVTMEANGCCSRKTQ